MSIPATMRALRQTSLNGPQDLCLIIDAPVPVPGPGEVLIRVAAALAALKPLGGIAAGQTVLIHAAAGGTGQAAVKMAKHYGATVIGASH